MKKPLSFRVFPLIHFNFVFRFKTWVLVNIHRRLWRSPYFPLARVADPKAVWEGAAATPLVLSVWVGVHGALIGSVS